jgi:hypothetical protein
MLYDLAVALPLAERGGRVDRDAALLLFGVEVHDGGAFVHLADLVHATGVVQDALGGRGLAGVDVGGDADVANLGQVACHVVPLVLLSRIRTENPRKPFRGNRLSPFGDYRLPRLCRERPLRGVG